MHIVFIEKAFVMKIILLIEILAGVMFMRSCSAMVSQPSKWLKFMTFGEGCFVIRN